MSTVLLQRTTRPSVDSHSIEPLTLRLKLASPLPPPTPQNPQMGFFRNSTEIPEPSSPISYRIPSSPSSPNSSSSCSSSSAMSDRSLDLCTEDLGNETGCTDTAGADFFVSAALPSDNNYEDFPKRFASIKRAVPRNFPPPLTTMSGGESIQFRQHRQDGRLVIEAVRAPPGCCELQAERSNGRVRLGFLTRTESTDPMSDPDPVDFQETAKEQEEVEDDCPREEEEEEDMAIGGGGGGGGGGGEEEDADCSGRGVDETNEKFGVRMENTEIYARTGRRCTEGGKSGLWGFGTFLVATS